MTTYLIDTNLLVYAYNIDSELHQQAQELMQEALNGETHAFIADKTLYEFYAIITDEKRVEKPVKIYEALEVISFIINSNISIIYPTPSTFVILTKLLKRYKIKKQKVFDMILAALAIENDIEAIITRNEKDFMMLEEIKVVNPFY